MIDMISFLPSKRKHTSSGWISFNAPCCVHRGDSQDKRQRGGLKPNAENGWSYHCFNCGYTASFILGRNLSFKARNLLEWLGVDQQSIEQINIESLRHRTMNGLIENQKTQIKAVEFEERDLPADLELIDINNPQHLPYIEYLENRCIDSVGYPYMVSPNAEGRSSKRIVIPFTHKGLMAGNTSRFIDNRQPKFISDTQQGYVFGVDLQKDNWEHAIVVEGVFDALAINGLAVLHNDVNATQAQVIKSLNKNITWEIVCKNPDEPWNYATLSGNPNITWEIVCKNPDKNWSYIGLSMNPNITWEIVKRNLNKPWSFCHLSKNKNITIIIIIMILI